MRVASYVRYSSENQSAASLEDQARNCRAFCARMGWPDPVVYQDAAMSGSRRDRPGYQRLLADATRFDVILVDDLSRLSRDSIEAQQQVRRLKFAGVRVVAVSDGIDTADKGHKLGVGLRGLMGELYLDDLRDKTHRGLTGRAMAGASAGGLPYGYRITNVGEREIDEAQAAVVRRIFNDYIAGATPRAIATALNREGIPSPRGRTWALTGIRGDVRRGIGILGNSIYVGQQVWNRSRWVKHPETGRRIRQERPAAEWITTHVPDLAIVTQAQWDAAQARQRGRGKASGGAGRPARHLLSGLLRCGGCDGPLVVVDRYNYGCARSKNAGTCAAPVRVTIRDAERELLAGIRAELLTDRAFQRFQRAVAARLRQAGPDVDAVRRRLQQATRDRDNVMAAILQGVVTSSTKAALEKAEGEIRTAEAELRSAEAMQPAKILPRARERWQALATDLGNRARGNDQARQAIAAAIGTATVRNENGDLVAEVAVSSSGSEQGAQICVVAGARSVPYLLEPFRVVLRRASRE